jgi:hypothetical protein
VGWKSAAAAFIIVLLSFAALVLYTRHALERIRACGADPLCQLSIVWEYTLVVIAAVLLVLILVDVILRLGEAPRRELSLYPYAAHSSKGGET